MCGRREGRWRGSRGWEAGCEGWGERERADSSRAWRGVRVCGQEEWGAIPRYSQSFDRPPLSSLSTFSCICPLGRGRGGGGGRALANLPGGSEVEGGWLRVEGAQRACDECPHGGNKLLRAQAAQQAEAVHATSGRVGVVQENRAGPVGRLRETTRTQHQQAEENQTF